MTIDYILAILWFALKEIMVQKNYITFLDMSLFTHLHTLVNNKNLSLSSLKFQFQGYFTK